MLSRTGSHSFGTGMEWKIPEIKHIELFGIHNSSVGPH